MAFQFEKVSWYLISFWFTSPMFTVEETRGNMELRQGWDRVTKLVGVKQNYSLHRY